MIDTLYRIAKICAVIVLIMLVWGVFRYILFVTGIDHSLVGCRFRDPPLLDCENRLANWIANAPFQMVFAPFAVIGVLSGNIVKLNSLWHLLGFVVAFLNTTILFLGAIVFPLMWLGRKYPLNNTNK